MKKIIRGRTIYFYDDEGHEIMYIDYSTDECIWYFHSENIITITEDMELYNLIESFMNNHYEFNDDVLPNYKSDNKLIWYSDCHYNPDDEWSIDSVSCLNIERKGSGFDIWCSRTLDKKINRSGKSYGICFSPGGNGKYSKNLNTGLTLQDDFVVLVYQQLLVKNKNKVLEK